MRTTCRDIGFPAPGTPSAFQPEPPVCLRPPSAPPCDSASSSRELPASSRVLRPATCPSCLERPCDLFRPTSASHGVLVPHRGINQRRPPATLGSPNPSSSSVRDVSRVLDGFLRHQPCGLVSSRCHVQGLPFRGLSLTAEPYRVSPADSCPRALEEKPPAV